MAGTRDYESAKKVFGSKSKDPTKGLQTIKFMSKCPQFRTPASSHRLVWSDANTRLLTFALMTRYCVRCLLRLLDVRDRLCGKETG
jgi:hypothetical protein